MPTRSKSGQRRFEDRHRGARRAAVACAAVAALGLSTGTWYAASVAAVPPGTVAPGGAASVHALADGVLLPEGVRALRHTTAVAADGLVGDAVLPSWSISANTVGSVTTAGDVALVDARGSATAVRVTVHVTNLAELQRTYSSFLLPIGIWAADEAAAGASWTLVENAGAPYLASTDGYVSYVLPGGRLYDVTVERGGSWATGAFVAGGAYAPQFYVKSAAA